MRPEYKRGVMAALAMLCAVLSACAIWADEMTAAQEDPRLAEARMLREALDEENRQLREELQRRDRELAELRSRYAALIVRSQEKLDRLENLEMQALSLLGGQDEETVLKAGAELMALERERLLELSRQLSELEGHLNAALDILAPSETIREGIRERVAAVKKALDDSLQPLLPAPRAETGPECRVRTTDGALRTVVIDKGYLAGVRNGMMFALVRDEKAVAVVKVVESRADMSAALLSEGAWEALFPGVVLQPFRP